jgi:hypothetical protein
MYAADWRAAVGGVTPSTESTSSPPPSPPSPPPFINSFTEILTGTRGSGMCDNIIPARAPPPPIASADRRRRLMQSSTPDGGQIAWSSYTDDECRAACDADSSCLGYSHGVRSTSPPPSPPPWSTPPPVSAQDRRRRLLQSSTTGDCFLFSTQPTVAEVSQTYTVSAKCYKKGGCDFHHTGHRRLLTRNAL